MANDPAADSAPSAPPAWRPLAPRLRRVAGVLIEKAKTTPSAYPLTLNALRTGCNQKSNRDPEMQLGDEQVIEAVDRLREMGAVVEVHDSGRVPKYRHRLYDWLGVDKVEIAVLAELLLRGAQTVGELRSRSARMEPLADLAALQGVLDSLAAKNLIVYLTPPGRGCVVTHALSRPEELDQLRQQYGQARTPTAPPAAIGPSAPAPQLLDQQIQDLRRDAEALRHELTCQVDQLRQELDQIKQQLGI